MGKGHYPGGSTLVGFGSVLKSKGRSGGIGASAAAIREQRKAKAKEQRRKLQQTIRNNQELARELGKQWAAEKGRTQFVQLALKRRAPEAQLAAALLEALQQEKQKS